MAGNANSGRRSEYNAAIAEKICTAMSEGKTLAAALRQPGMPSRSAVNKWAKEHPDFADALNQARIDGAWAMLDEAYDIAAAVPKSSSEASQQRERLKLYCWGISKIVPHVFGDNIKVDLSVKSDARIAEQRAEAVALADRRLDRFLQIEALRRVAASLPPGPAREAMYASFPESRPYVAPIETTATRLPESLPGN